MRALPLILILSLLTGCVTGDSLWTKEEVVSWCSQHRKAVGFVGYQGSDQAHHHYIVRYMDDCVFIRIRKEELKLNDERPFSNAWSAPLYFYLVDPARDFEKIEPNGQANQ
jgi:hypothetical protein